MDNHPPNITIDDIKKSYIPKKVTVEDICRVAKQAILAGKKVLVISKGFVTSYDDNHRKIFKNILSSLEGHKFCQEGIS